jgi:hypothetical protein
MVPVGYEMDLADLIRLDGGKQGRIDLLNTRPPLLIAVLEGKEAPREIGAALHASHDGIQWDLANDPPRAAVGTEHVVYLPVAEELGRSPRQASYELLPIGLAACLPEKPHS